MFADFEKLLKTSIGLDAASIGVSAIERAVRERQRACQLPDTSAYWAHLRQSAAELQALIEVVVVPETWFFRDAEAFAMLARIVRHEWLPTHPTGILRLLSVPSSTGEEAYSMAMTLIDAGIPAKRFLVDAFDVSAKVLATARRGEYGKNSFRAADLSFRTQHFDETPQGYRLKDRIREQVHFAQHNLLTLQVSRALGPYDAIFCRNLLIYFDRPTQDRAIDVLRRLLTNEGLLFVAPAETSLMLSSDFVATKVPLAFAFRKRGSESAPSRQGVSSTRRPLLRRGAPAASRPRAALDCASPVACTAVPETAANDIHDPGTAGSLDHALRLADEGRFAEAAAYCEDHLQRFGPSAEAFHVLGVVRDASGSQSEAAACYRKALYLDPQHQEVLIHFALLLDTLDRGDEAAALRTRARRLAQQERPK